MGTGGLRESVRVGGEHAKLLTAWLLAQEGCNDVTRDVFDLK
jgi:hypothetical protein